jgi:hypothetical protein
MLPSMAEQPPPSTPPVNPSPPPGPEASRAEWRAWRRMYGRPYWMGGQWFGWGFFWPAVLIALGLYWLLSNLGLLWWLRGDVVWPVLLILFGLALIFGRGRWWR